MKMFKWMVLAALVLSVVLPFRAFAQDGDVSHSWALNLNINTNPTPQSNDFVYEDSLPLGLYLLSWSGNRSITMPAGKHGSLYGSLDSTTYTVSTNPATSQDNEFLYKFFYLRDNEWHQIGQLFDDVYSFDNTSRRTTSLSEDSDSFTATVLCEGIGIQYGAYYTGTGGSASGTAGISAAAVPEPSTFAGLLTGVALNFGAVSGYLKRRKTRI